MIVKICGVTLVDDATAIASAGADAIGMNFWPGSPRFISVERAAEIAAAVAGRLTRVGVFVDADPETIERVRRSVPLDVVQLHGDEHPLACERWAADGYWKAVRSVDEIGRYTCRTYLLDARVPGMVGGTGVEVPVELARAAIARAAVVLAGGLRPETVGRVVQTLRPAGVDVASGVERSPGVKDLARVEAFVRAARAAEELA